MHTTNDTYTHIPNPWATPLENNKENDKSQVQIYHEGECRGQ